MKNAGDFFLYARLRYQIFLARQAGQEKPWTDDPVLQRYRFCNIFREDDTVTKWVKEHVRDRYADSPRLLQAVTIARWINRVSMLEKMIELDLLVNWSSKAFLYHLGHIRPMVTGAYMVKTPKGIDKANGIAWCIDQFVPHAEAEQAKIVPGVTTIEDVTKSAAAYPYLGPFLAYEVATDLRHTHLLGTAPDIMTWANPGPGATRGISRLVGEKVDYYNRHSADGRDTLLEVMQQLLVMSQNGIWWPSKWPAWEMREVEHTLCEYDKYTRATSGEGRPKQRYNKVKPNVRA